MTAFEGWESEEESEEEESSEGDDSRTGFFTADFSGCFGFRGLATCREGVYEGEAEEEGKCSDIFFGFSDDILGRDWGSMLDLDVFGWLLLLCGRLFFRLFFVGFFRVGRLWHLGDGRNFGHGEVTSITVMMVMDSDVVLLGTDLPTSILAASVFYLFEPSFVLTYKSALTKAGYKIIHVDPNDYYGGDHATLNVDEIVSWANLRSASPENESTSEYLASQRSRFVSVSYHGSPPPAPRQYSLSLLPSIIPSVGPLISALINSGVSRYGGFKLLEKVALYHSPGHVQNVPNSKEDVFNNRQISLIDKRRLMRFFTFVSGDFEDKSELQGNESTPFIDFLTSSFTLESSIAETIVFALAFCSFPQGL